MPPCGCVVPRPTRPTTDTIDFVGLFIYFVSICRPLFAETDKTREPDRRQTVTARPCRRLAPVASCRAGSGWVRDLLQIEPDTLPRQRGPPCRDITGLAVGYIRTS